MSKLLPTKPKLIVIVGPTASGKSALAIKIARKLNGEIVSADSRQIYRGMDIGTAKPPISPASRRRADAKSSAPPLLEKGGAATPVYAEGIKHHLIDIKNPNEEYTVADYKKGAIKAIEEIIKKGKLPILVGGTGLYVKAVVENLEIPEVRPNPALRKKLEMRIKKEGLATVYRELVEQDPEAAYIVDGKNPRRVIRALEIAFTTKKPFSAQRKKGEPLFDVLKIGVALPPEKLRKRIETRVDEMVKDGLVNEVKGLIRKYGDKQVAFDAIGYREIITFLYAGKSAEQRGLNADLRGQKILRESALFDEAIDLVKKNTWAFAKRQMTWFKKDEEIVWIHPHTNYGLKKVMRLCKKFLRSN
ncbi:MAG: tRNA (adenosine(37)-N6)-dimethylallyltransferase MiaA [Candidatus Liptonbacteria bacterium]|nr:tRNA (adenosine(37)-N6)-dimethylallyltransferase MiaA [Candidatus Liptonbacteria bacterium]